MSIFTEGFTITPPGSPDGQEPNGGAGNPEDQEDLIDDQQEDFEEDDQDDQDDENLDEDIDDDEPSYEQEDEDNSNKGDLILGKFKTQDDLANAYLNLQREFTKSRQPQSQQPAQPQTTAQQLGTPEQAALFKQQFEQNPLGVMQYLIDNAVAARTAPIHEQRQTDILTKHISEVAKEYKQVGTEEGMKQLFGKVAEIAEELGNPNLCKNPTARVLRMAAAEAFGDTKQAVYDKAKQAGRKEAEAARAAKKGLPAARTGAKAKATSEQPLSEEDSIRQGILAAGRGGRGLLG